MDDEQARKHYVTLQALQEQEQQLREHLDDLDGRVQELQRMTDAVKGARDLAADEEILVPLTNGIFMPARAAQLDTLYLNVGADTIIRKTPEESIHVLESQQEELETYRKKLVSQQQELRTHLDNALQQAQRMVED